MIPADTRKDRPSAPPRHGRPRFSLRPRIGAGIRPLQIARNARRKRHAVMFRIIGDHDRKVIDVLRLLHDGMDLVRRRPFTEGN